MIEKYENKMASAEKKAEIVCECVRECEMPGVGAWKPGDVVSDPETVEKVKENPNFKIVHGGN